MASDWFNIFNNSYLGQFQPSGEFKRPELGTNSVFNPDESYGANMVRGSQNQNPSPSRDSANALQGMFAPQGLPTPGVSNPIGSPLSQNNFSADRFRQLMGFADTGGNFGKNMAAAGAGTGAANILQKLMSERPAYFAPGGGPITPAAGVPLDEFNVGTISDSLTSGDFMPGPETALSFLPMAGRAVGGETGSLAGQGAKLAWETALAVAQPEVGVPILVVDALKQLLGRFF